jgi:hypothetical protein
MSEPFANEENDPRLERAARALAEVGHGRSDDAARTRARILQSHRDKQQRSAWLYAAAAVLALSLGVPTAWAWATGRLAHWLEPEAPAAPSAPSSAAVGERRPPREDDEPVTPEVTAPSAPELPEPITEAAPPEPAPVVLAPPVEAPDLAPPEEAGAEGPVVDPAERRAYREAHALHFDARDAEGALAAWDRYLTRYPSGRFAIEARYNRALCLVRLGRENEAREALAPFAAGRYGEYRRREAAALTEAMTP